MQLIFIFFLLSSAFIAFSETNSIAVNPFSIRGDRLEVKDFTLSVKETGNYLTFNADPAISYFKYQICANQNETQNCIQSSTIFKAIEIPPSLGNKPFIRIWACITQKISEDINKNCSSYELSSPDITDLDGKRLALLTEKENLTKILKAHANEAFLAAYYYLSTDQNETSCQFKGLNPDMTLSSSVVKLNLANPYFLQESFEYTGFVPNNDELTNYLLSKYSASPSDELRLTGENEDSLVPTPKQTWTEWFWSSVYSLADEMVKHERQQGEMLEKSLSHIKDTTSTLVKPAKQAGRITTATLSYMFSKEDPPKKNISEENLPKKVGIWESWKNLGNNLEEIADTLENEKVRENVMALYKTLVTDGQGKKIKNIATDMVGMLRQVGVLKQEFPQGWINTASDLNLDLTMKTKVHSINSVVENARNRGIPFQLTQEEKDLIENEKKALRKHIDQISLRAGADLEEIEKIDKTLQTLGAIDPPKLSTTEKVNLYLESFHSILRLSTRDLSDAEWDTFKSEHAAAVKIFGLDQKPATPLDAIAGVQKGVKRFTNLAEYWPPQTAKQVNIIAQEIAKEIGSYDSNQSFWDDLYKNIVGDSSIAKPSSIARKSLLTTALGTSLNIKSGADLYDFVFKTSDIANERGLLQGMIFSEYEIQEKIKEATAKGVMPEERRKWAYDQLWSTSDSEKQKLISKIRNKFLSKVQVELQSPIVSGLASRLTEAYLPEEWKHPALKEAIKSGATRLATEKAEAKSKSTPKSPSAPQATHTNSSRSFLKRLGFRLTSTTQNEPGLEELQFRDLEQERMKLANQYYDKGHEWLAIGLFASQIISMGEYELKHSTGICTDLKSAVTQMLTAQKQIQDLQNKINSIDKDLFILAKGNK